MKPPKKLIPDFDVNILMMSLSETKDYGHSMHNVPKAWLETKGEGIKVAVIDTGLPVHRDLTANILDAANFTDSPIEDLVSGHATHCAGIIAACENDEGIVGIAPRAKLLIGKALDDQGGGDDRSISQSVLWAIDKGANVISMSLGAPAKYASYFPKTQAAITAAYKKGIVIICASGNENASQVGVPARFEECISVAAVDSNKQRANFSNKGPLLDFASAGVNVLSTFKNNTFAKLSGTSMACPQIAGISALILSNHLNEGNNGRTPINGPEDVREHLRKICLDVGKAGFDEEYGHGIPVFGHINDENPDKPPVEPPKKDIWSWMREWILGLFG